MADVQQRLEKLEDFRSEYEALNQVRIKGFHELIEEAKLLQAGSKEFWRLKAKLFDLLWKKLEPVMSQVLEREQLGGAKSELAQCLQKNGLVGVLPVGRGGWGGTTTVDVRTPRIASPTPQLPCAHCHCTGP